MKQHLFHILQEPLQLDFVHLQDVNKGEDEQEKVELSPSLGQSVHFIKKLGPIDANSTSANPISSATV